MSFLPGNCTYRFSASAGSTRYLGLDGQIARFSADTSAGCDGRVYSGSGVLLANNLCGSINNTPLRSISGGVYYILLKYYTNWMSTILDGRLSCFNFYGASITNEQTGTTLSMSCSCPTGGSCTSNCNQRNDLPYAYQIQCTHAYLNWSSFTTRYPWNENCQPCY